MGGPSEKRVITNHGFYFYYDKYILLDNSLFRPVVSRTIHRGDKKATYYSGYYVYQNTQLCH